MNSLLRDVCTTIGAVVLLVMVLSLVWFCIEVGIDMWEHRHDVD